ncbi:hypothetical protein LA080_002669 [Diaporthe eres]|uniref:F-box domain-containing protein n=1 Tax=Diaporthe vaccinii TaxID=105482 RepID=A0ABR4E8P1_9PEZI|nr:hypothetical protein LA080_002669 [Diaporthe eres]
MASPTGSQGTTAAVPQGSTLGSATRSHDGCFITALSTELIDHIIDHIPYESQVDFACTCKRIADCSSRVLERHQEAFKKYRVASDISPVTVPTLLRSVFGRADPILAWHVRSIEIWYDRTSWLDWKTLRFDQPLNEEETNVDSTSWKWQDDELEEYLEDVDDQFVAMLVGGDEEILTEAREHFEDGLDGILKALLIAHCPRLRDVKFVTHEHKQKSTLGWLKRLIQGSILHGSHWPPGLCNVQNVAVGVESDTWMTTRHTSSNHGHLDPANESMEIFSTLLRLPRLTSIYYNDLRRTSWDDETDFESRTLIPKHSSTVKHIFLDDCGDMTHEFRSALSRAPRALETFTLRAGNSGDRMEDADQLVSGLCGAQSNSLHTLMFYGPYDSNEIHGYRCSVYRNEELNSSGNLETVAIDISDVELDCFYSTSDFSDEENRERTEEENRKYFVKWFRETAFPATTQRLVFWGRPDECYMPGCRDKFLDWLEDALINVIESWRWKEGWDSADEEEFDKLSTAYESFLENLKAIYLEDMERQYKRSERRPKEPRTDKVYFRRLVEVAKEAGIDVYTLTNRAPAKHSHDFPTAPDKYDLRSGPWWERRDETADWVFDVYKGRRVPPGCGKCGKCEQCLGEYVKELWESLDE